MDNKKVEEIYNRTFGGLAFFYRDTELADRLISKYQTGQILTERGFTDASFKGEGLATNLRYIIASACGKDLSDFNPDSARFGHIVLKSNAFFKVLDIYKIEGKIQVFLLEIPEDAVEFFTQTNLNIEKDLIKKAREDFDAKHDSEPIPELQSDQWKRRIEFPLGMNDKGGFFYQANIETE